MAGTKNKNILMVIAHQNFRDEELLKPKAVFEKAGAKVTIASTATTPAKGMLGATQTPNMLINDVNVNNYDAVIFVGGGGSEAYYKNATALNIAKSAAAAPNKILGAICIAPGILATAGVLRNKKATIWAGDNKYVNVLKTGGASYTGESVTKDGNIITANGPEAAQKFGEEIIRALG